ncbi:MAG: Gmad2 immunoglobulin-like domain-containing protein [Patescibacteria group bacterium]
MKKIILGIVAVLLIACAVWFFLPNKIDDSKIMSFETCVEAGYPVMESYPRQCRTSDGRLYVEEIMPEPIYVNTSAERIVVDLPYPGAVTGKEFKVMGKARAFYFEGSFPVEVLDKDGNRLFIGPAQAQGDWMVDAFVPFEITVKVPDTYIGPATLIMHKDNPSGLPENDASMSFPITIEY